MTLWPLCFFATSAFSSVKEMAKLNTRGKSIVFSNFGFEPLNTWNYGNRPILGRFFLREYFHEKHWIFIESKGKPPGSRGTVLKPSSQWIAWKWVRVWSHDFGFPYPWIHAMHFGEHSRPPKNWECGHLPDAITLFVKLVWIFAGKLQHQIHVGYF